MQMLFGILCFSAAFMQVCGRDTQYMNNIGYVLSGYNIFKGNPMNTDGLPLDPGFTRPVLKVQYTGQKTPDQRFFVPDAFWIRSAHSCTIGKEEEAKVIKTTSDYQNSLQAKAYAEPALLSWSASFSFSADYKSVDTDTKTRNTRVVSSAAECSVYQMGTLEGIPPNVTDDFAAYANKLPEDYGDGSEYFDLFEKYGTHIMEQVTMGARYGFSSTLDEAAWNTVTSSGFSVQTAAALHAFVKAGGSLSDDMEKNAERSFSHSKTNSKEISLGSKPAGGDADKWAQQSFYDPLPISYKLKPICNLLPDAAKQKNCWHAAKDSEYCTKKLQLEQKDVLCTGESPVQYVKFADEDEDKYGFGKHVLALSTPIDGSPSWKTEEWDKALYFESTKTQWWIEEPDQIDHQSYYRCSSSNANPMDPTVSNMSWNPQSEECKTWGGSCPMTTNATRIISTSGCRWDDECSSDQTCNSHQCVGINSAFVVNSAFETQRIDVGKKNDLVTKGASALVTKNVYV